MFFDCKTEYTLDRQCYGRTVSLRNRNLVDWDFEGGAEHPRSRKQLVPSLARAKERTSIRGGRAASLQRDCCGDDMTMESSIKTMAQVICDQKIPGPDTGLVLLDDA